MWSSPDVVGLFSNNVVSFSRNVVLRGLLFSINLVSKPRMLSVRGDYVLSSLQVVDDALSALIVQSVTPLALEVAINVQEELQKRLAESDRLRRQYVERAHYEAEQARIRYMRVDPNNRLVADTLEALWNEKLRQLEQEQDDPQRGEHGTELTEHVERVAGILQPPAGRHSPGIARRAGRRLGMHQRRPHGIRTDLNQSLVVASLVR